MQVLKKNKNTQLDDVLSFDLSRIKELANIYECKEGWLYFFFTIVATTDFYDGSFSPKSSCTSTVDYVIICKSLEQLGNRQFQKKCTTRLLK